ncbi:MAG: hypothetical protein ACRC46_14850 [Thermoguttaceae bacterium]
MTKLEMEVIPDFDVLKWKAETQAAILRETEGMTDAEVSRYFQKAGEKLQREKEECHARNDRLRPACRAAT